MKKLTVLKVIVSIIVFFISIKVIGNIANRGNTDMTLDMAKASIPIVYLNVNGEYMNALHGYTQDMEGSFLRGNITPINADRTIEVKINTYGFAVAKVAYEIRNLDCSRLIEDTELESFDFENDIINATLSFKDLIDENREYMLIVKLITGEGKTVKYYTRIINVSEIGLTEKLAYAMDFSEKAFREETAVELKKFMETNSEGNNSSYGYVNIHSNFNQLHYGSLNPELLSDKIVNLISVDNNEACIQIAFRVKIKNDLYNVKEFFRIRDGAKRLYLMEYERTMNQLIDDTRDVIINGKIINGIVNDKIEMKESNDANITAFVQTNSLYRFNNTSGNLVRVFSYRDSENDDERTNYDAHDIKILSVDDSGNVYFLVYGYINRGIHEGQMGAVLYNYDAAVNTIEEVLFIPYTKAYEILKTDIEQLSYINSRDHLFLFIDGTVYSITLESKDVKIIATDLDENRFVSSKDNSVIAWQTGGGVDEYRTIQYYALEALAPTTVESAATDIIVPLGFIGNDLIFGSARISDITTDEAGRTVVPMYKVEIRNIKGESLLTYEKENTYIIDCDISEEMIILTRYAKNEDGALYKITDDEILNNSTESTTKNKLSSVITEEMETTYQIVLYKEGKYDSVKLLNPKEVIYEGNKEIALEYKDSINRYYVYSKGGIDGIYTDPSDAVVKSNEVYGVTVDKRDSYVFESGNRKSKARIETIGDTFLTQEQIESGSGTLKTCLEEILNYNEVYKDTDALLSGNTVLSVLKDNIKGDVLDLSGCSLDSVLYYVGRGYPVLVMTEPNKAMIIVGYDSKNTVLYDPEKTEIFKYGLNDSKALFDAYGNKFITYVE